MKVVAVMMLAAFLSLWAGARADEQKKPVSSTVTGQVVFACPKGQAVRVQKCANTALTLWVVSKCPKKAELEKQIKSLQKGTTITATYFTCPKSKKGYVTGITAAPTD